MPALSLTRVEAVKTSVYIVSVHTQEEATLASGQDHHCRNAYLHTLGREQNQVNGVHESLWTQPSC